MRNMLDFAALSLSLLRKYESSHNSGKHAVYNFRVDGVG
jgi:hypothetical protein